MLVQELFINAMEITGATTLDEVPEASEMQKCKRHANMMLDSWSSRFLLQATIQESFTVTANKRQYTIGTGGDFNTRKPIEIVSAFIRDTSNVDYPVSVVSLETYDSIDDKLLANGRPEVLYYDPAATQQAVPTGTISLYNIPDANYTLFLNSQKYLTEFVNLTDTVTFEPVYYDLLVNELACRIWRPMGRKGPVPPDIERAASRARNVVMGVNHRIGNMRTDLPGVSGALGDNPLTGGWMS